MTREEAWRRTKGYLYDVLSGEEADEIIKALEQEPCENAINRQAALELFTWTNTKEDIWYGLKLLPSVVIPSAEPFKEMTNGEVLEEVFGSNFYPPLVFCADWYKEPYKGEHDG